MSLTSSTGATPPASHDPQQMRRVLFSSFLGSAVEFYDFLLYGTAAALVFGQLFFSDLTPVVATIASFGTLAVGYIVRPLGGVIFGHFGDRIGRKSMLVLTMTLMGVASFAIGLLPTYATIGVLAPVLLIVLRLIQGFAVGGEWGGAALMALEHSDENKRGFSASFANMGAPGRRGALHRRAGHRHPAARKTTSSSWGWRIPFLLSAVLVGIGLYVRLKVTESPLFEQEVVTAVAVGEEAPADRRGAAQQPEVRAAGHRCRSRRLRPAGPDGHLRAHHRRRRAACHAPPCCGCSPPAPSCRSSPCPRTPPCPTGSAAPGHDRRLRRRDRRGLPHPAAHRVRVVSLGVLLGFLIGMPLVQAAMYGPLAAFTSEIFATGNRYTGHPWATSCPPPSGAASPR